MVGDESFARLLRNLNLLASVSFILGGSLFAIGAVLAQQDADPLWKVNVTYLMGGVFFSLGGYLSIMLVANAARDAGSIGKSDRMRWWGFAPHRRDWQSAIVLFIGTLLFAVSLVAAFASGLTPRQSNGWIWLPDILGCVCFLVSGRLALLDLGAGLIGWLIHDSGWRVAAVNQVGSILFFLAGVAAFIRPATSAAINVGLVNWGTFAGAVCFAIGGVLQVFDTPTPTRTVVPVTHDAQ